MTKKRRRHRDTPPTNAIAVPATPEFGQHHDVDTRESGVGGLQGWRVHTRLDRLLADEHIGAAEWQAGDSYRRDLEVGELGGRIAAVGERGGGDGCPTTARLMALGRLGAARQRLLPQQRVAMDAVAADLSWPSLGQRLICGRDAARTVAVAALRVLAEHYRLYGKATRIRVAVPT